MTDLIWPDDPQAQVLAVLVLLLSAVVGLLLSSLRAERRHLLGKLGRARERAHGNEARLRADLYRAEAELASLSRTFDEHIADALRLAEGPRHAAPTAVAPLLTPSGSWPAIRSVVVDEAKDPDATTFIDVRGEATT